MADPYKGQLVLPYRVTCFSSRCRSYVQGWSSDMTQIELLLEEKGWKRKRGVWRCAKHWGLTAEDEFGAPEKPELKVVEG